MTRSVQRIAIIGGGISGVAAAYQLAVTGQQPSVEFVLYEASERLGGIVETRRSHGFVIECGPDSWVTEKPWARELAVELGLAGEIIASNDHRRRTYLLEDDHLVAMPDGMRMMVPANLDALDGSPLFSEEALRAYRQEPERADELKLAAAQAREDESVASFVRRHFGGEVADKLAGPLLAGVFGGSIDSLSVRAVMPAFVKMEREHGSLVTALQRHARTGSAPVFTTLTSGLGTLIDSMTSRIPKASIRLQAEVRALVQESGGWRISSKAGDESYDAVIVATPAHITRRLLAPLDSHFDRLLAMDATSAIVIALAFTADQAHELRIPDGFGFLVPQRQERPASMNNSLLACTFVHQKFAHRAPEGAVLLRGFFGGDAAPALMNESDASLIARTREQLSRVLGSLPEASETLVRRWPRSLPQYAVGHLERMAELEARVQSLCGLVLIGNAYHGVGLPDLIREGRAAASKLVAAQ